MAYSRRPLLPCALVALALASTACGLTSSNEKPKRVFQLPDPSASGTPKATGSGTPKPGSSAAAAGTPKPGSSTGSTSDSSARPGTSGAPSGSAPAKPVTDLTVTLALAKTCVMPGQSQTVDVTVNLPNAVVIIDTLYEDKKDGQTHGGFKPDAKADAKGHYSYTFTVLPTAPKGGATVFVRAGNREHRGEADKAFIVGAAC